MNNILNKIAQMERNAEEIQLASHRVELSLVDDFKKEYEKALDVQAKAENAIIDYNDLAVKIIANLNAAGQAFLKANARFQDIENMAADLGVEVSPQLKNKKQIISVAIKEIDGYVKKISSNKVNI